MFGGQRQLRLARGQAHLLLFAALPAVCGHTACPCGAQAPALTQHCPSSPPHRRQTPPERECRGPPARQVALGCLGACCAGGGWARAAVGGGAWEGGGEPESRAGQGGHTWPSFWCWWPGPALILVRSDPGPQGARKPSFHKAGNRGTGEKGIDPGWLDTGAPDFRQESLHSPRLGAGLSLLLGKLSSAKGAQCRSAELLSSPLPQCPSMGCKRPGWPGARVTDASEAAGFRRCGLVAGRWAPGGMGGGVALFRVPAHVQAPLCLPLSTQESPAPQIGHCRRHDLQACLRPQRKTSRPPRPGLLSGERQSR